MIRPLLKKIGLGYLGLLILSMSGCGSLFPPNDGDLEGKWQLITENPGLGQTYLTFDKAGNLIEVTLTVGIVSITYDDILFTETSVSGNNVTIESSFGNSTLSFNGTFNDNLTEIDGTLTAKFDLGVVITINGGPARLIKQ
jgi:YD repeat-containing protein